MAEEIVGLVKSLSLKQSEYKYRAWATLYDMRELSLDKKKGLNDSPPQWTFCMLSLHVSALLSWAVVRFPQQTHTTHPQHPPACEAGGSIVWPVLTLFHLHITQPAFHSSNSAATITHSRLKKRTSCSLCQPIKSHLGLDAVRKLF